MSVVIAQDIGLWGKHTSHWTHRSERNDQREESGIDISAVFIRDQFAYDECESHLDRSSNTN